MASKTDCIRKACRIGDEVFLIILDSIKSGKAKTEKDIERIIRGEARKRKVKLSFPPVIATAKNAAEIHHKPKNSKLKKGFLVMDFGFKVNGFCSDMTRTVYLGKPSKEEKKIYCNLLKIQNAASRKVKPGIEGFDIDIFARKRLGKTRELFTHSLGHGVGKKIHEKPNLSPKSADTLKKGDIVTVEPGIYSKGKFGIRIEDSILVGKNPEILTKSRKSLIEIRCQ